MKKGFTLIESLIVVAIMSVIAGIGTLTMSDVLSDNTKALKSSINKIKTLSNIYYSKNRTYNGFTYNKDNVKVIEASDRGYCVEASDKDVVFSFNSTKDAEIKKRKCTELKEIAIINKDDAEDTFDDSNYTFNPIFNR